jgi:uncharacterized protein
VNRPRDPLGRPLPRGSDGPVEPDPEALPPADAIAEGQRLLDAGRAFRAHEVFEAVWKATHGPERNLWRGLAQLAVAVTHAQRGNEAGARALLLRSAETLAPYADEYPYGVDVAAVRAWASRAAEHPRTATVVPRLAPEDGRG